MPFAKPAWRPPHAISANRAGQCRMNAFVGASVPFPVPTSTAFKLPYRIRIHTVIRELQTFLAIVRYGTFSAAAEQIGLTQSAVSAQIKRLESDLQAELFKRSGRTIELNEAGRCLVPKAEHLLQTYQLTRASLQGGSPPPRIRIGAIPTAQAMLLPKALVAYQKHFPTANVLIKPGTSAQILDQVDANTLDLAVVIRPPFGIPAAYSWKPLLSELYVAIAPAEYPEESFELLASKYPFIRYDRISFGGRPVQNYLERNQLNVQEIAELKELEAIISMVEHGLGISIVPACTSLKLESRDVRIIPLKDTFHRDIGAMYRTSTLENPAFQLLISCLKQAAEHSMAKLP